jgi:hypothetical protein
MSYLISGLQTKTIAYLSGPIGTEIPDEADREERKARFYRTEKWISTCLPEWEVVNPLDVAGCIGPDDLKCDLGLENIHTHTWECWLRYDLAAMLRCNTIVLLPYYDLSRGATLEYNVAGELGFEVFMETTEGSVHRA